MPPRSGETARALLAAANRMLRGEVAARARSGWPAEPDAAFVLTAEGGIAWQGETVARLTPGETVLAPRVEILAADFLDGPLRDLVRRRLEDWMRAAIGRGLKPLLAALALPVGAAARGLLFRLGETLGTLDAVEASGLVVGLDAEDRRKLSKAGIRFGTETIHVTGAPPARCRGDARPCFWSVHAGAGACAAACCRRPGACRWRPKPSAGVAGLCRGDRLPRGRIA